MYHFVLHSFLSFDCIRSCLANFTASQGKWKTGRCAVRLRLDSAVVCRAAQVNTKSICNTLCMCVVLLLCPVPCVPLQPQHPTPTPRATLDAFTGTTHSLAPQQVCPQQHQPSQWLPPNISANTDSPVVHQEGDQGLLLAGSLWGKP